MLKNKIKEIIYSDDLTDVEREDWFLGVDEDGDWLYDWEEIYESRIIQMANDIITDGSIDLLGIRLNKESKRLNMAIINFLKSLSNDWYTKKELDKLTFK